MGHEASYKNTIIGSANMKISQRKLGTFVLIGSAISFFGFNELPRIVLATLFWTLFPAACLFVIRGWKEFWFTQPDGTASITEGVRKKR